MAVFTARSNFKTELITGNRRCQSCLESLKDKEGLVVRWSSKHDSNASIALCDDECWETFDHNFWLEKRFMRAKTEEEENEAIDAMLPRNKKGEL